MRRITEKFSMTAMEGCAPSRRISDSLDDLLPAPRSRFWKEPPDVPHESSPAMGRQARRISPLAGPLLAFVAMLVELIIFAQ
jgi:hypothetical protein